MKKKIRLEDLLCFFIMICPILDAASFLFRNYFNTSISISTILRPVIPIISIIYIFLKDKIKIPLIVGGLIYGIYAVIHLYIFTFLQTQSSYGNLVRELQYIVNYTFMIMNLFIYLYVFIFRKKEDKEEQIRKIKKSLLISFTIYISFMILSILTGTSSATYTEDQMGYKGWFESGNSVGAIMLIMLFILLPEFTRNNSKKIKIWIATVIVLAGIYLTSFLGTRVGLIGFVLVIVTFALFQIFYHLYHGEKINKKVLGIGTGIFVAFAIAVILFGSMTIARRKLLKEREDDIYDEAIGEASHVTGDVLKFVKQIQNNEMPEEYMSKPVQAAMIDLYNFNNKHKIPFTNMRMIQLVYHFSLVREQHNIFLILFGNGYMTHYYEMIFEMEVPAFLCNFGIFGFILYFIPFFIIAIYGFFYGVKNIKKIKVEAAMAIIALCFSIVISFLAGYTFFNQSVATVITAVCVITIYEIIKMKGEKIEENNIWNNGTNFRWSRESSSRLGKQASRKV